MVSKVLLSRGEKTTWQTPKELWNDLNRKYNFILDACTEANNILKTPKFYTIKEDGLSQPWFNITYCNPPYGRNNNVDSWLKKGKLEQENGITSVFLLPSRTGTRWFHEYIYNKPDVKIEFLPRRLRFRGAKSSATFDSMILFDTKETVLELNGCSIEAYPSNHIDAFSSLTNPKFILLDECDFFRKNEQEDVRHVSERYIGKSDPFIVMVSTPNNPGGLFDRIEKEEFSSCLYKKLFLDFTYGKNKIYTDQEIAKARAIFDMLFSHMLNPL